MNAPAYPHRREKLQRAFKAGEAAHYCSMSESQWRKLVKDEEAPKPVQITDNMPRWYLEDLDAWLDSKKGVSAANNSGPKRYAR